MPHRLFAVLLFLALGLSGCLQESAPYEVVERPQLEVSDGQRFLSSNEPLIVKPTGEFDRTHDVATLTLRNNGDGVLAITSIRLIKDEQKIFSLSYPGNISAQEPLVIQPKDGEGRKEFPLTLQINPVNLTSSAEAAIEVVTNPDKFGKSVHILPLRCELPQPGLSINPGQLDFGMVYAGESKERTLQLVNTGSDMLVIHSMSLIGDAGFALLPSPDSTVDSDSLLKVAPGTTESIIVQYTSVGPQAALAELIIESNAPSTPEGSIVPLQANSGGPCIDLTPGKLQFGGKLVGKIATMQVSITSCGDEPLVINKASLSEDSDDSFSLVQGQDDRFPMVLGVNESADLDVAFVPTELATLDDNGTPQAVKGWLTLGTNTYGRSAQVEISGYGVDSECPTPVIHIAEGEEVCPQTKLNLSGSQSYSPNGAITSHMWEVVQPGGSSSLFVPSASQTDPTFEANVAGAYTFRLRVQDASGQSTGSGLCPDAEKTVLVIPCDAIHVELLWHTPNDMDETDTGPEAGADLDLHFLHPFAQGFDIDGDGAPDGYFDNPFDAYWYNSKPDWGEAGAFDDNPALDRDDTDGAGPENMNLNIPQDGLAYKVGVHYWHDHGYGPSDATVRIYIQTVLVFEQTLSSMVHCDLWEVAKIHWPSGTVTPRGKPGSPFSTRSTPTFT